MAGFSDSRSALGSTAAILSRRRNSSAARGGGGCTCLGKKKPMANPFIIVIITEGLQKIGIVNNAINAPLFYKINIHYRIKSEGGCGSRQ